MASSCETEGDWLCVAEVLHVFSVSAKGIRDRRECVFLQ